MKFKKFIIKKEKKKKIKINVISLKNKVLSNKRKRIEETLFNIFALEENDYFNINYIFLKKLNSSIYLSNINLDNFRILETSDKQIINLIITINSENFFDDFNILIVFDKELMIFIIIIDVIKFNSRVVMNFDYSRYFFANRFIFIIYEIIYSRLIKNIKDN